MQTATVAQLKRELKERQPAELLELCLRLAKFKKENKELLTYLLFEAEDKASYVNSIKHIMDEQFDEINRARYFYIKKSVRKILKEVKKYIRYSKSKETEVELLLYFCQKLRDFSPSISRNRVLTNTYERQLELVRKRVSGLHEDLQYDYNLELEGM